MKKQFVKINLILIVLLMFIVPNISMAEVSTSSDYTIESYDIEMVVNENNTFNITEKISTYFYVPKHRNI